MKFLTRFPVTETEKIPAEPMDFEINHNDKYMVALSGDGFVAPIDADTVSAQN